MQSILADKLKTVTLELRRMEKDHFAKVQELHGNPDPCQSDELLVQELEEEPSQGYKTSEVQSLAKSITELAVLFKDLSMLVVE